MGKELRLGVTNAVSGVSAKEVLVGIALGLEDFGHAMVGFHPVVHAVAHDVGVEEIPVTHGKENPQRLLRAFGYDFVVKAPCTVGRFGVEGPLLIDERA